jgi:hypothetical protein
MSTNGTTGLREKIAFQANLPTLLTLDHSDGQPCAGRYGEQYMYTFDRGTKIAWLDPEVRAAIQRTGAGEGDQIFITRGETREGNRKKITWNVERVEDEPAQPQARLAPKPPATCTRPGPDAPRPAAPQPPPSSSGNGAARAALADALAIAIDVAAEAEQLAAHKGLAVRFQAEDIRALALTVYIGSSRGERRAA